MKHVTYLYRLCKIAVLAGILGLGACAVVNADAEGIAIRHAAENKVLVARQADEHCAKFDKVAVEVQRSPIDTSRLVQTVVTTFACIARP